LSSPLLVVRVSAYPHRVAETVAWEKAEIERLGCRYEAVAGWEDPHGHEVIENADVVLCHYEPIGAERLEKLARCRLIVMGAVGLDGVDVESAIARGITICNMPDICVDEVAEHTMALLLASVRKVLPLDREVRSGQWKHTSPAPIPRLRGSRLGLIGAGRIGRAVAARASAFGMRTVAYDPFIQPSASYEPIGELASLEVVASTSDFLSIHVPLTTLTRHLISHAELRSMKPSAFIVNTARGAVLDEPALIEALDNGWIRGAALDVFEDEPPSPANRLFQMSNVVLSPHIAGFSDEVVDTIPRLAVSAVATLMVGSEPPKHLLVSDARSQRLGVAG
jgi:D-3-phosphoglycerate dehydrogenase